MDEPINITNFKLLAPQLSPEIQGMLDLLDEKVQEIAEAPFPFASPNRLPEIREIKEETNRRKNEIVAIAEMKRHLLERSILRSVLLTKTQFNSVKTVEGDDEVFTHIFR